MSSFKRFNNPEYLKELKTLCKELDETGLTQFEDFG